MSNVIAYSDLHAFHPGYYVEEIIEEMAISQAEFAKRMGTSTKTVSQLVSGKIRLTDDLAQKLASMMGMNVDTWLNLQKEYDLRILEIESQKRLDAQAEIVKLLYYELKKALQVYGEHEKGMNIIIHQKSPGLSRVKIFNQEREVPNSAECFLPPSDPEGRR